jgi:uncharacterized damage-inducible protein DinB
MDSLPQRIIEQLDIHLERIERCLGRLPPEALWRRLRDGTNSIGNLCLHLAGNESHYIGRGIGGADYARDRPAEFQTQGGFSAAELAAKLCAARALTRDALAGLSGLSDADLARPLATDHPPGATVLTVLLHVAEHYAYHTGQIVLLTRAFQDGGERVLEWGH